MPNPDWNKIAGADTAAQRLEAAQPSPAERLIMRRLVKEFDSLTLIGKVTFAVYVYCVMKKESEKS